MNALQGSGVWFDDVRVGDRFASAVTITETHIVMGAGLIGDFNPHHMNAEFAKTTRFGTPILHGMITSSIMGAAVGMYFHGTAVAYLEHHARFLAPVRARRYGDHDVDGDRNDPQATARRRDRHAGRNGVQSTECRRRECRGANARRSACRWRRRNRMTVRG